MQHMGFVPFSRVEPSDEQLCQDVWVLAKGEERGGVNWDTLELICCNIAGVTTPEREREAPEG